MRYFLALVLFVACGPPPDQVPAPSCPAAYPNAAPSSLCCDAEWAWCVTPEGRVIGAP
jgi:hypothetical protein